MNKMDKPSMDQYLPKIDREKIERMLEIRRLYDDGKITLEEGRARLKAEVGSMSSLLQSKNLRLLRTTSAVKRTSKR